MKTIKDYIDEKANTKPEDKCKGNPANFKRMQMFKKL